MAVVSNICANLPCPISGGAAICIRGLCLCENSLWYNSSRLCETGDLAISHPLRSCSSSATCRSGKAPLRELCVTGRCIVSCNRDTDCRQVNAACISGVCMCNYGMVMSASGCNGLKYVGSESLSTNEKKKVPVLGFWVYAAIVGGVIFGSALVLVIVHALFTIRPKRPGSVRKLTIDPSVANPFAPEEELPPQYYSPSRRRTHYTSLAEKRFNLKPIPTPSPLKSSATAGPETYPLTKGLGNVISKFNQEHPDLVKKLDDPESSLSPSPTPSDATRSDLQSISSVSQDRHRSSDTSSSSRYENNKVSSGKKVKWTPSTRDNSPDRSTESSIDRQQESRTPEDASETFALQNQRLSVIEHELDDFVDMGLGRRQNRLSIVK